MTNCCRFANEGDVVNSVTKLLEVVSERVDANTEVKEEYTLADSVIPDVVFLLNDEPLLSVECKKHERTVKKAVGQCMFYDQYSEHVCVAYSKQEHGNLNQEDLHNVCKSNEIILLEFCKYATFDELSQYVQSDLENVSQLLFAEC